jgi:serine/threonine protein kinase
MSGLIKSLTKVETIFKSHISSIETCTDSLGGDIKYIRKILVSDRLFRKEIAVAKAIGSHPNVLTLIESDELSTCYRLLYPYYPNGDLFDYSRYHRTDGTDGTDPVSPVLLRILLDILKGVQCLHSHGIVHRDLKMENVLLDANHRAVICDFGFCESFTGRTERTGRTGRTKEVDPSLLRGRHVIAMGTVGHVAPDIMFYGQHASPATDVFSLGVVFYEVTTGLASFTKKDMKKKDFIVDGDKLVFPKGYPADLAHMIRRMLSFVASDRPTIDELIDMLIIC